jgi:hypothetical protein
MYVQLVIVVRTALLCGKCMFAAGAGYSAVAFVLATGGNRLTVFNSQYPTVANGHKALHELTGFTPRSHRDRYL